MERFIGEDAPVKTMMGTMMVTGVVLIMMMVMVMRVMIMMPLMMLLLQVHGVEPSSQPTPEAGGQGKPQRKL